MRSSATRRIRTSAFLSRLTVTVAASREARGRRVITIVGDSIARQFFEAFRVLIGGGAAAEAPPPGVPKTCETRALLFSSTARGDACVCDRGVVSEWSRRFLRCMIKPSRHCAVTAVLSGCARDDAARKALSPLKRHDAVTVIVPPLFVLSLARCQAMFSVGACGGRLTLAFVDDSIWGRLSTVTLRGEATRDPYVPCCHL